MEGKTTASKIKDIITKIGELEAVKRHYDSTIEEMESVLEQKDAIENKMIKELEDINKLEQLGVKSIFHQVLGNKEQQLEKERQEYLQVTLQHKEIVNAVEVIQFEKEILEKKLESLDNYQKQLETLKRKREEEIMLTPGKLRNELNQIYRKLDEIQKYNVELGEALLQGSRTLESLEVIYTHMKKARDWGTWDMVQGNRGKYQKAVKYNAIDRAMNEVSRAKLLLRNFNKELSDVGYSNQRLALQVENIAKFPGIIFDNLISDWIVQKKIKNVLATIGNLMDEVNLIIKTLMKYKANSEEEYLSINLEKNRLLEEN